MNWRRISGFTGLAFAGFYVFTNPTGAAGVVRGAAVFLAAAAESLSKFVNALS